MVKKILTFLFIGASLVLMFYPWISNFVNQRQADITVNNYKEKEKSLSERKISFGRTERRNVEKGTDVQCRFSQEPGRTY